MTREERAAALWDIVVRTGHRALVMGGHAVRHYGFERVTVDFDFHVAVEPEGWDALAEGLRASGELDHVVEGTSWRRADFRRFVIGRLADGREERLELWRRNHLLPPFADAWERREEADYGGHRVAFLGLEDLLRSKETEREGDWADVRMLEQIADERLIASADDATGVARALAGLRSRRGLELVLSRGWFELRAAVAAAGEQVTHPISRAILAPAMERAPPSDDVLDRALAAAPLGSTRHFALVEAARNRYRSAAVAADRADKERAASADGSP